MTDRLLTSNERTSPLRSDHEEYIRRVIERHRLGQRNDYNDVHALIAEVEDLRRRLLRINAINEVTRRRMSCARRCRNSTLNGKGQS